MRRFSRLLAKTCLVPCVATLSLACASAPSVPESSIPDTRERAWRHALVIDASSSASTLQIYEWRPGEAGRLPRIVPAPRTGAPDVSESWEKRVRPGLGSYAGNPEKAAASLEPLLAYALARLGDDPETLAGTSLFLRATAGLRLLSESEREEILAAVDRHLEATPFGTTSARVITGTEEGVYGWIAANYVLGHLEHGGPFPTVGALDLGGASAQITFVPLDFPARYGQAIRLGGNVYHLYTKSYLGLGQDQAREAVANPACFLVGFPTPEGPGTGNLDKCREAIRTELVRSCPADERPCSLFGSYQPPVYGEFLALSVFAYAADFFDLDQRVRPIELEEAGRAYCARDWQRWVAEDPKIADDPYAAGYCYTAAHILTLLTDGFGFPADTDRISAPLKAQGWTLGWTLGALVYELAGGSD